MSRWLDRSQELLAELAVREAASIAAAVASAVATIRSGGLIHAGGTGHSTLLALESFYRAGGLAAASPIWGIDLFPPFAARASTQEERDPVQGRAAIERAGVRDGDTVFIASQSGINGAPVEMALASAERGATVVAISSRLHAAKVKSRHTSGKHLFDAASIVIDTGAPYGDALLERGEGKAAYAPVSSLLTIAVWSLVLEGVVEILDAAGETAPIWKSSNAPGGDEWNEGMLAAYAPRVRAL